MAMLKKYWWVIVLMLVAVAYFLFKPGKAVATPPPQKDAPGNTGLTPPSGLINPDRWMQLYNQKIESIKGGEPFSEGEMANRSKYKWTPKQHMHNKAVWYANSNANANVNANEWNWPKS